VFENIITSYESQAGAIEYHMNWPNPSDPYLNYAGTARKGYYNISGIPAGGIDGSMTSYSGWLSEFQARLLVSAPITITLSGTYSPILLNAYITAHVHNESTSSVSGNIYVALTEDDLYSLGRHYNRVERAMNVNGWGEAITIGAGGDEDYTCTLPYNSSWKTGDMRILCWVQNSSHTVFNSKWEPWSILTGTPGVTPTTLGNIKAVFH
jgi:hypothetical protein